MKQKMLALLMGWAALAAVPVQAITVGAFGPQGQGGSKNNQSFTIGPGGSVYELDAFLSIPGLDLNGSLPGVSAQLSRDALPAGLVYTFGWRLSADAADLVLTYSFSNTTSQVFTNMRLAVLLDAEIDQATNTFFNEYGVAAGAPGGHGYEADQWQIDEPGFQTGTLFRNLYFGTLNNSNAAPITAPNDVAMALSFLLDALNPGDAYSVLVMISEQAHTLSSFWLTHQDLSPSSTTVITFSGVMQAGGGQMNNPSQELLVLTGQAVRDGATNGPAAPTLNGLAGVTVLLRSNAVPIKSVATDRNGRYAFSVPPGLAPGTYAVAVDAPAASGYAFLPATAPGFATANPAVQALPAAWPVLNFDFRGAGASVFNDVSGLVGFGLSGWQLDRATGSLLGTLSLTNLANSGAALGPPFQFGLKASTNFYYRVPAGTLPDGVPYLDLTAAVSAQVPGGVLGAGQSVVLTNALDVFSRYRTAPTNDLFEVWATRQ